VTVELSTMSTMGWGAFVPTVMAEGLFPTIVKSSCRRGIEGLEVSWFNEFVVVVVVLVIV
jgi:hypothetical protein